MLRIAEKLLCDRTGMAINVWPSAALPAETFTDMMVHEAEVLASDHDQCVVEHAQKLVQASQMLTVDSYQHFDTVWHQFTVLYLSEKLFKMMDLSPSHITERLRLVETTFS